MTSRSFFTFLDLLPPCHCPIHATVNRSVPRSRFGQPLPLLLDVIYRCSLLAPHIFRHFSERPLLGISYALAGGTLTFALIPLVADWGRLHCSALLFLAGAANCGPDSLFTGSVTMMIGERYGTSSGAGVTRGGGLYIVTRRSGVQKCVK